MDDTPFGMPSPQSDPGRQEASWPALGELHAPAWKPSAVSNTTLTRADGDSFAQPESFSSEQGSPAQAWGGQAPQDSSAANSRVSAQVVALQRKKARRSLIFGLVLSLLVAPIVMVGYVLWAADLPGLAARLEPVTSGASVTVDDSRGYFLIGNGSGALDECIFTSANGTQTRMDLIPSTQPAAWVVVDPGKYTLSCQVNGDLKLMGASGINPHQVTQSSGSAMLASSVVGFFGFFLALRGARRLSALRTL